MNAGEQTSRVVFLEGGQWDNVGLCIGRNQVVGADSLHLAGLADQKLRRGLDCVLHTAGKCNTHYCHANAKRDSDHN